MTSSNAITPKRTTHSVSAVANCPFSIAQEYATEYLRAAEAGCPQAAIRLRWPVPALQHRVAMTFGRHLDIAEEGRRHDELRLSWRSGSRLLPDFRGTLRFRIDRENTLVLLEGSYVAPLGFVGRLFDAVVGGRIARASLSDLANRIAAYLSARQQAWLRTFPPTQQPLGSA
jgi:hypothetical protein